MTKKAIVDAFEHLRPGEEMEPLEAAARSRSEADWLVGHERHARRDRSGCGRPSTARSRSGASRRRRSRSSPGARRRSARSSPSRTGSSRPTSRPTTSASTRAATSAASGSTRSWPARVVEDCRDQRGEITKLEKKEERERSQLLYDLTSLQRDANTRFGFSAKRTLGAAQKLYEQHKAITYPRTNSRWLSSDMIPEIRPTAELVGQQPRVREGRGVRHRPRRSCRSGGWSTTRRSRTTTRSSPPSPRTTWRR